ncbi:hypothetical protein V6N11_075091 [Hibiscus sabdariffa]|uniref:SH3 domain-containing protein n=1 Tax=Hibiscus sabdariffa TaxID=183260 RepID=A0ABR2R5H6_9ROSI
MNYPSLFSSRPTTYSTPIREEPPPYTSPERHDSFENPLAGRSFDSQDEYHISSGNIKFGTTLYDFTAGGDDELSLTTGEELEIQYEVNGWFYVKRKRPGRDGKMAGFGFAVYSVILFICFYFELWANSIILIGDDCISIVNASSVTKMKRIYRGPGHGVSIGSLGKDNSAGIVTNKGGLEYGIQMVSGLKLGSGTTESKDAVKFACSETTPCSNINLETKDGTPETYCNSAKALVWDR